MAHGSIYQNFSDNLRTLVATKGSIADTCRALNLNRQQFNKYLAGHGLPSRQILAKIAAYFNVEEIVMLGDPDALQDEMRKLRRLSQRGAGEHVSCFDVAAAEIRQESNNNIFPEGCYDFYYPWPDDNSLLVRSVVVVFKEKQQLCFRRYTRLPGVTSDLKNYPAARHDGIITSGGRGVHMIARNQRGFGELSIVSIGGSRPQRPKLWFGLAMLMTPLSEALATRCTLAYRGGRHEFRSLLTASSKGLARPGDMEAEIYRSLVPGDNNETLAQLQPYRFGQILRANT